MITPRTDYAPLMKKLWALAGEIGTLGEDDKRYAQVYKKLSDALDVAEANGLIKNVEESY